MDAVRLGPLLCSGERLAAIAAIWLFLAAARRLERWSPRPLSAVAWRALIVGLVVVRIGYVGIHWEAFRFERVSALNVWQGGFSLAWGLAGAGIYLVASLRLARAVVLAGTAAAISVGA